MYLARSLSVGKTVFPHALITEVGGAGSSQTLSILALNLEGRYERFQASVGRDRSLSENGSAAAAFEVWADGTLLYRSAALRPSRGRNATLQPIDLLVRGTRSLQLVTRFADTETHTGNNGPVRASGCLWGDPRLSLPTADTPVVIAAAPPQPQPQPTPQSLSPAATATHPSPTTGKTTPKKEDLRRAAVRIAMLQLASGLLSPPGGATPPVLPLRVALLPLRPCIPLAPPSRRGSSVVVRPADLSLQDLIVDQLPAARRGANVIFQPLSPRDTAAIVRTLPPSVSTATATPSAEDLATVTAACRKKGAQAVALATLLPADASTSDERLELSLFDAETGALIATRVLPLPAAH